MGDEVKHGMASSYVQNSFELRESSYEFLIFYLRRRLYSKIRLASWAPTKVLLTHLAKKARCFLVTTRLKTTTTREAQKH